MYKELLATTVIALTVAMYVPYIRSIRAGRTRPHAFSWIIWTLSTFVVFSAQIVGNAGVGAWPMAATGLLTSWVAVLAYRSRTDKTVIKGDWTLLAAAIAALLCWLLTSDPLAAVVVLTGVELMGFGPTFRVAYSRPRDERIGFYSLAVVRNSLSVVALEQLSLTTALYPATKCAVGLVLVLLIAVRRRQLQLQ